MKERVDLTGKKFGRWSVIGVSQKGDTSILFWDCICECGGKNSVRGSYLKSGASLSCGCLKKEMAYKRIIHGNSRSKGNTGEYRSWQAMKARCTNHNYINYKDYGARGISVCQKWIDSFEDFLEDVGPRPTPKHTLDRIEVNGNYEPGNCRWATSKEQNSNTRATHFLEYRGERMPLKHWAERLGVWASSIYARLGKGESPETVIEHFFNKKLAA